MLVETCTFWGDKYIDINNSPNKKWEELIKFNVNQFLCSKKTSDVLAYHVTVHFCPRKEIPINQDKRKVKGYYEFNGNNSCMMYVYNKISALNMDRVFHFMLCRIQEDFTDTTLHYNNDGNSCHCNESEWRRR